MKKNKCFLCGNTDVKHIDFTTVGSCNKAEVFILGTDLTFYGDDGISYNFTINHCPKCGKKLYP